MKNLLLLLFFLYSITSCIAQTEKGTKERIKIHSKALDGNLVNDPAERDVTVYFPPSYHTDQSRHFPVLYMLHGFTDSDSKWFGWEDHWINLHEVLDQALSEGRNKEMIVVMPNAYNRFKGSMYSSSVTIGDWETFISKELVEYIDSHYRTLAKAESRGLAGHSMGGYGTIRLGMKYPDVWSAIYLLSPCCMEGTMLNTNPEFINKFMLLLGLKEAPFKDRIADQPEYRKDVLFIKVRGLTDRSKFKKLLLEAYRRLCKWNNKYLEAYRNLIEECEAVNHNLKKFEDNHDLLTILNFLKGMNLEEITKKH